MVKLSTILADPDFKALSYEDQQDVKSSWVSSVLAPSEEFRRLSAEEQRQMVGSVSIMAPEFEEDTEDTRRAKEIYNGVLAGNRDAIKMAEDSVAIGNGLKKSLLGNALLGVIDIFDGDEHDTFKNTFGKQGRKINAALESALNQSLYTTYAELQGVQDRATALNVSTGIAEALVSNITLIGGIGKAGLLTKNIFPRVARMINNIPGSTMFKVATELGEQAVQAVGSAAISTANKIILDTVQDDRVNGPWTEVAKAFGAEIAQDWMTWAAFVPLRLVGKSLHHAYLNTYSKDARILAGEVNAADLDAYKAQLQKEGLTRTSEDFIRQLSPDGQKVVRYLENERVALTKADLSDPVNFLKAKGMSAGYMVETTKSGKIDLTPMDEPSLKFTVDSPGEANRWLNRNMGVDPASLNPMSEFTQLKEVTTTQLPKGVMPDEALGKFIKSQNPKDLQLATQHLADKAGVDVKVSVVQADVDHVVATRVEDTLEIRVPKEVTSVVSEDLYRSTLRKALSDNKLLDTETGRFVWKTLDTANVSLDEFSIRGMTMAAKNALGIDVKPLGQGNFDYNGEIIGSVKNLQARIYGDMVKYGKMSIEQTDAMLRRSMGWSITVNQGAIDAAGTKVTHYELRDSHDNVVEFDTDFERLIKSRPEVVDALSVPADYAPKMFVVDPELREIRQENVIATGNLESVYAAASHFTRDYQYTGKAFIVDGKPVIVDNATKVLKLVNPITGQEKEFIDKSRLTRYYTSMKESDRELRGEINARGFAMYTLPDGSILAATNGEEVVRITSKPEIEAFLKNAPIPDGPELIPHNDAMTAAIEADVVAAIKKVGAPQKIKGIDRLMESYSWNMAISTNESFWASVARKTGNTAFLDNMRELKRMMLFVNRADRKASAHAHGLWNHVKTARRSQLYPLFSMVESEWDNYIKRMDLKVTEKELLSVRKTKIYFNELYAQYGLDADKMLRHYIPRITEWKMAVAAGRATEEKSLDIALKEIFGGNTIPEEIKFFAKNRRITSFMDTIAVDDPAELMVLWTDQLAKNRYLGSALENVKKTFADAQKLAKAGQLPESVPRYYQETVMEMFGAKTMFNTRMAEASVNFTKGLAKAMQNIPVLKNIAPDQIISDDLVGGINKLFTFSTQAMRPFNVIRNSFQTMLLSAYTGMRAPWEAMDYVTKHPEYINRLVDLGYLSENMYSQGSGTMKALGSFSDKVMRPLANTDLITRGTAFRTADVLIDKSYKRLLNGTTNAEGFIKEIGADMADGPEIAEILRLVKEGNIESAKLSYGDYLQKNTMFEYEKGTQGAMSRGFVGRLFGKLAVYPMGTIDLYRKALSRGSAPTKAARMARVIASSLAVYWMFNQVGIDYKGFLWTDPFEFSGGPFFTMGVDALNAIGNRPENLLARNRLARSAPTALIPGADLIRGLGEVESLFAEGEDWDGILRAIRAPIVKEEGIRQFSLFGYETDD